MLWVFAILIVLALGGVAVVAAGKGTPMSEEYGDQPDALVPASGPLRGEDLRRVRFSLGARGYRMAEVDALLDRLASQLEQDERRTPPGESRGESPGESPGTGERGGATSD